MARVLGTTGDVLKRTAVRCQLWAGVAVVALLAALLVLEPIHALQSVLASHLSESQEAPVSDESEEDVESEEIEALETRRREPAGPAASRALIPPASSISRCHASPPLASGPSCGGLGFFLRC